MKNIKWANLWPYLVFIASISLLVYLNARLIDQGVEHNKKYGHLINTAGRQRLLSQRFVTEALFLTKGQNPYLNIDSGIQKWHHTHATLRSFSKENQLSNVAKERLDILFGKIDPIQQQLHADLSLLVGEHISDSTLNQIVSLQSAYLPLMDDIVNTLETNAEVKFQQIRDEQVQMAFISGLVLILEIIFIILPYHKKLLQAYRKLKEQNKLIEQQNEKIETHFVELSKLHVTEELTLSGINAGVWNWDIRTGKENWSPNFFRLLGYEPEETPSTFDFFLDQLLHRDDIANVQNGIAEHLKNGTRYRLNIRMKNKNGTYRWYETSGMAAKDANGEPTNMAGSIIDIEEKIQYQKQLEQTNLAKDKLFAIIAHDLRSPINNIKSLLDLKEGDYISDEEFTRYFDELKQDISFLSETLDNILTWAMSQMSGLKTQHTNFPVNVVFTSVKNFYRGLCKQKNIGFSFNNEDDHIAYADINQVHTMIRNLVSNAIKFTPSGGNISISSHAAADQIQITVADTGIGMSGEAIDQILNHLNYTTFGTNKEKGTGLGIGLIQDLLALNNGSLTVVSNEGKGTAFTISIPAGHAM